jgi:hypothetical protein
VEGDTRPGAESDPRGCRYRECSYRHARRLTPTPHTHCWDPPVQHVLIAGISHPEVVDKEPLHTKIQAQEEEIQTLKEHITNCVKLESEIKTK